MRDGTEDLFDLILRQVSLEGEADLQDLAIRDGRIAAIGPRLRGMAAQEVEAEGAFAFPGFVDSHIHLDKACILDRCRICEGTLSEAVRETASAKAAFTEEDVYGRAARVVEAAILHGTTRMRSFVEVDPRAGLRSFAALKRIRADYAVALDLELCAFAQEGLTQEPETDALLEEALRSGADLVGGCPYTDPDPQAHIDRIFALAVAHDVAVDFHLDFSLDPSRSDLSTVIAATERHGWQGRVSIGHVTTLSAMEPAAVSEVAQRLAGASIAVTVLPATDLFLTGRDRDRLVPRGVAPAHRLADAGVVAAIATNNVLNPFTPYGDASLIRMANLYANLAQLSRAEDMERVFAMVGAQAARQLGAPYGLAVGSPATLVLLDAAGPEAAVRTVSRVIAGWKNGRQSFDNGRPRIYRPDGTGDRP